MAGEAGRAAEGLEATTGAASGRSPPPVAAVAQPRMARPQSTSPEQALAFATPILFMATKPSRTDVSSPATGRETEVPGAAHRRRRRAAHLRF